MSKDRYRILHVADIHSAVGFAPSDRRMWWASKLQTLANEQPFCVCICSGDLDDKGSGKEVGYTFLSEILRYSAAPQLVLTPGNHDAARPTDMQAADQRFEAYRRFVEQHFPNACQPEPFAVFAKNTVEIGPLLVLPLNTCQMLYENRFAKGTPLYDLYQRLEHSGDAAQNQLLREMLSQAAVVNGANALLPNHALYDKLSSSSAWIRLAVSHHPLWGIPHQTEILEPFDIASNGLGAVDALQQLGFRIFFHGHKHYMGASLLKGMRSIADTEISQIAEAIALGGGHMKRGMRDHDVGFGFQTVDIIQETDDRASLEVKNHTEHDTEPDEITVCKVILERNRSAKGGSLRWVSFPRRLRHDSFPAPAYVDIQPEGSSGAANWVEHLSSDIVRKLGFHRLTWKIDELGRPDVRIPDRKLLSPEQVDQMLTTMLLAHRQFLEGNPRGVKADYRAIVKNSAATRTAMLFVDVEGNGTWGHPDLIENTLELFRAFNSRNAALAASWQQGHLERVQHFPWRHPVPEFHDCFVKLFSATGTSEPAMLAFGLCRILVWRKSAFYTAPALMLLTLHRFFGVPVLFVDSEKIALERALSGHQDDLHLEWESNDKPPCGGYIFDQHGDRIEIPTDSLDFSWAYCKALLKRAECPFTLEEVRSRFRQLHDEHTLR